MLSTDQLLIAFFVMVASILGFGYWMDSRYDEAAPADELRLAVVDPCVEKEVQALLRERVGERPITRRNLGAIKNHCAREAADRQAKDKARLDAAEQAAAIGSTPSK